MLTTIRIAVSLLLLAFATGSCRKLGLCRDAELRVTKQPYTGRNLRLDGFYYGNPGASTTGPPIYEVVLPYRNGVLLVPGGTPLANLEQYVEDLRHYPESLAETKYFWGLFAVTGSTISLAQWGVRPGCYSGLLSTGRLLNDSTFVIDRVETTRDGSTTVQNVNVRYDFQHTVARPDSTNPYF